MLTAANSSESAGEALVSVVFVSWNAAGVLPEALASLHRHDHGCTFEVIVVDNGSTDGTAAIVAADWPAVTLLPLTRNVGFGAANNLGIEKACGRYILLLNSDTVSLPTTLSGLVQALEKDPSIGCVGARHINGDGTLQRSTNAFPTLLNDALELFELARLPAVQRFLAPRFPWFTDHSAMIDTGWVNGACMMFRKAALDEVGLFDPAFFIYVEEVDLCYRLHRAGWRIVFSPEAEVIHIEGHAFDSNPSFRLRLRFWGHVYFYRKHYAAWRYRTFALMVSLNAACRIAGIALLGLLKRIGYTTSPTVWEVVVADRGRAASHRTCMLAWLKIMLHMAPMQP
jgi:hypothetical protein